MTVPWVTSPFERMQPELERGRDPEVRARAAQAPEEVGVLVLARPDEPAVGGDELDGEQAVDRQAELALQAAHPAAEREAGDAGVRDDSDRADEPVWLRRVVELAEQRAAVDPGGAPLGVDLGAAQAREVDHDPAVARGEARDAVTAAPHGDDQLLLAGEPDGRGDVVGARRPDDQAGPAVDHAVPDHPRGVVAGILRAHDFAPESVGQFAEIVHSARETLCRGARSADVRRRPRHESCIARHVRLAASTSRRRAIRSRAR